MFSVWFLQVHTFSSSSKAQLLLIALNITGWIGGSPKKALTGDISYLDSQSVVIEQIRQRSDSWFFKN